MKTDIVILSRDTNLLKTCLHSISKHVDKSSIENIYVGWNNENPIDDNECLPNDLPINIVKLDKYNFAQNNNFITNIYCTADVILFMNDDVELVEDSVTKALLWLKSDKRFGTIGIKLLYPDRTIQHNGQFVAFKDGNFLGVGHIDIKKYNYSSEPPLRVIGNTGAFLMLRREDFVKVGGFDEGFKNSLEDVKLNLEILKLGKVNLCDRTTWAWHPESQTRKQASCVDDMTRLTNYINTITDSIFKGLV